MLQTEVKARSKSTRSRSEHKHNHNISACVYVLNYICRCNVLSFVSEAITFLILL